MNRNYNDDAKEQVRLRADIASVVGRYVNLKQRGSTMLGLCPFHKEKTPSFTVNPARGVYHCFGCGQGGDVFRFVQEMEGVGFREALEMLAEETGVELPKHRREPEYGGPPTAGGQPPAPPDPRQKAAAKTELLDIHKEAAEFYYQRVKGNPQAVGYFKSRGLLAETVKEFRLGYAPDAWSELCGYLQGKKIPMSKIVECGLAVSKEGGSGYDRFRNRVMFPLCDLSGRVIAFAGRGLDAATEPKYLNSPESALYKKNSVLYGLHKARDGVRELGYVLIVEGYMDYLTLYQAGVRNAAAASGTAFTAEHAHIIKRFAQKAVLVFDGDRAGVSAAQRAAAILAPLNLQVSILTLPSSDDPDSFVKREGAEAFRELIPSARPAADFLIDKLISESDGSPHGKSRAMDELMPYAHALSDSVVRGDFLDKLAQRLRLDKRVVLERFNSKKNYQPSIGDSPSPTNPAASGGYAIGTLEEDFLRILLTSPELTVTAKQYLSPEILTDPAAENIYSIILDTYAQKGGLDGLFDACGGDLEAGRLISMLAVKPVYAENIQDELVQKIFLLRRKYFKARVADVKEELIDCPKQDKGRLLERLRYYGEQLKESDLRE
ncbi:MAG: DNA primase [Chitinispirillales bacterium]|jgi:DNA primase|nr:DNA primase [Chitinispirillales bacterium]